MATEIGSVTDVKVSAFGTPPELSKRALDARDGVFADELVETVAGGALRIQFLDQTDLRLGSGSRVKLDKFVYDPDSGAESLTVELGTGIFRLVTGDIAPENIEIKTPAATIGIRGTDIILQILAAGAIVVALLKGKAILKPLLGDQPPLEMTEGSTASVSASGDITKDVPPPSVDYGLGYDAGRGLLAMMQSQEGLSGEQTPREVFNDWVGDQVGDGTENGIGGGQQSNGNGSLLLLSGSGDGLLLDDDELDQADGEVDPADANLLLSAPEAFGAQAVAGLVLEGTDGIDILVGGPGNDIINGNGGIDVLLGLGGDDIINGGTGIDGLIGGPGADQVTGGGGNDIFILFPGDGGPTLNDADLFTDFTDGQDFIFVAGIPLANVAINNNGGDAVIQGNDGEFLAVVDGAAGLITAGVDLFAALANIPLGIPPQIAV